MSKQKFKRFSKRITAIIVCAAIIGSIFLVLLGLQIAFMAADTIKYWRPPYDKVDLAPILAKKQLTEEDYQTLYAQTGLTETGVNRALARGSAGKNLILEIQKDYFTDWQTANEAIAPLACTDFLANKGKARTTFLENGDIVVTSSTHISSVRIGHSGLIVDAAKNRVLQANVIGSDSSYGGMGDFTTRINFMILSPKVSSEDKQRAADYAANNLVGIPYHPFAGLMTDKNGTDYTQCSHLIWRAYKEIGLDLDSNGGGMVYPRDIANSPDIEVVQVFGFDPVKLWK